jgi:hypothetical protein
MVRRVSISVASGRDVAERWRYQYYERKGREWSSTVNGPAKNKYDALCALGPNPDIDKVAEIIGNKSWSYLSCSGCNDYVASAVSFGSDYSESEILLCAACVEDAGRALKANKENQNGD